jgi:microcystin-dependent protein
MDVFLGEIRLVPYNFEPQGWAFCAGQQLEISQNTALFAHSHPVRASTGGATTIDPSNGVPAAGGT